MGFRSLPSEEVILDTLFDDVTHDEAISLAMQRVRDARIARSALVNANVPVDDPRMVAANDEYDEAIDALMEVQS